jgi:succinate dehydrogenase flavin-adding protein (antitoxin of CptAB toxin-antitoxin module)
LDANAISAKKLIMVKDTIVKSVLDKYKQRSEVGIKKYNKTMDRNDLNLLDWLTHLQEELMDATLYVEKLKEEYKKK